VNQRKQEFGIRIALGASTGELVGSVMMQTLRLALLGVAIGLVGSLALSRVMSGLLYGVDSTDPVTFAVMVAVLLTVAVVAGFLPARLASRVDPAVTLRAD